MYKDTHKRYREGNTTRTRMPRRWRWQPGSREVHNVCTKGSGYTTGVGHHKRESTRFGGHQNIVKPEIQCKIGIRAMWKMGIKDKVRLRGAGWPY